MRIDISLPPLYKLTISAGDAADVIVLLIDGEGLPSYFTTVAATAQGVISAKTYQRHLRLDNESDEAFAYAFAPTDIAVDSATVKSLLGFTPMDAAHPGKNVMLDNALAGSAYTVTGPFLGLISSSGWSSVAAADVMTSHSGWSGYSRRKIRWSLANGGMTTAF